MNDIYEYLTNEETEEKFRLCVWESSRIAPGLVRWCVERREPELEWWLMLEIPDGGWLLDDALTEARSRLKWWAENYPVAV